MRLALWAFMALLLAGAAQAQTSIYGDPVRIVNGHLELAAQDESGDEHSAGYARIVWVDANEDGDIDAGDGLYLVYDDTAYGPFLFAGDASIAPSDASYWVAKSEAGLSGEVNLGALTTGLVKITVSGGTATPSTAVAGTDYVAPGGAGSVTGLTANRIPYASGATALADSANLAFTAASSRITLGGDVTLERSAADTLTVGSGDRLVLSADVAGSVAVLRVSNTGSDAEFGGHFSAGASGLSVVTKTAVVAESDTGIAVHASTSSTSASAAIVASSTGASGTVHGITASTGSSNNAAYGGHFDKTRVGTLGDFNEGGAPATPPSNNVRLYAKTDGLLYSKDDAGTETLVSGGAGSATQRIIFFPATGTIASGVSTISTLPWNQQPRAGAGFSAASIGYTGAEDLQASTNVSGYNQYEQAYGRWSWTSVDNLFPTPDQQSALLVGVPFSRAGKSAVSAVGRIRVNNTARFDSVRIWITDASGNETAATSVLGSMTGGAWYTLATAGIDVTGLNADGVKLNILFEGTNTGINMGATTVDIEYIGVSL